MVHVAGLTVGQDISDRELQFAAGLSSPSANHAAGTARSGPWVATIDEVPTPTTSGSVARSNGDDRAGRRAPSDLVFSVPRAHRANSPPCSRSCPVT